MPNIIVWRLSSHRFIGSSKRWMLINRKLSHLYKSKIEWLSNSRNRYKNWWIRTKCQYLDLEDHREHPDYQKCFHTTISSMSRTKVTSAIFIKLLYKRVPKQGQPGSNVIHAWSTFARCLISNSTCVRTVPAEGWIFAILASRVTEHICDILNCNSF